MKRSAAAIEETEKKTKANEEEEEEEEEEYSSSEGEEEGDEDGGEYTEEILEKNYTEARSAMTGLDPLVFFACATDHYKFFMQHKLPQIRQDLLYVDWFPEPKTIVPDGKLVRSATSIPEDINGIAVSVHLGSVYVRQEFRSKEWRISYDLCARLFVVESEYSTDLVKTEVFPAYLDRLCFDQVLLKKEQFLRRQAKGG